MKYPAGIELIEGGCSHYPARQSRDFSGDPDDFGLDPYFSIEDLLEPAVCEFCNCTEFNACPGGCAWSERYLRKDRPVCSQCEEIALIFDINWGAFDIWRHGEMMRCHCGGKDDG